MTATTATSLTAETAAGTGATHRRLVRAGCAAAAGLANGAVFLAPRAGGGAAGGLGKGAGCLALRAGGVGCTTRAAAGEHPCPASGSVLVSVVFGLRGWAALAVLERWTRRPVRIWSALAAAVVLLSMVPIALIDASGGTKAGLAVLHVVVALALLPMLRRR